MPRKGENIYKRKDGRWEGRYIKSRTPAGKANYGYVYGQNGYVLQADEYYPILDNGVMLLCSDGISDYLPDSRISEILHSANNLESAGKQLVNEAVASHDADNATVMLIPLRR